MFSVNALLTAYRVAGCW